LYQLSRSLNHTIAYPAIVKRAICSTIRYYYTFNNIKWKLIVEIK